MTTHAIPEPQAVATIGPRTMSKTPLADAAQILADLCDQVDGGAELDGALVQAFSDSKLALADAVDRRIAFDTWIRGAIDTAKAARDEYAARAKMLELVHERFKANTQAVVEARPDLPYFGKLGKIALQKSPPSLKLGFFEKHLTEDMIRLFAIPDELVKTEVTHTLDTAKVKADILAGKEYPWATVEQAQHIRFRK